MSRFRDLPVDFTVDVRSRLEFWLGHLPGALNIPVDTLPLGIEALAGVTPTSRILVYCAGGTRSAQAAAVLGRAGFLRVVDGGGMADARQHFEAV